MDFEIIAFYFLSGLYCQQDFKTVIEEKARLHCYHFADDLLVSLCNNMRCAQVSDDDGKADVMNNLKF